MICGRHLFAWLGLAAWFLCGCGPGKSAGRAETALEPAEPSVLVVRVLDAHGPLSGVEVEVTSSRSSTLVNGATTSTSETESRRTDEGGWLRIPIPRHDDARATGIGLFAVFFAPARSEEVRVEVVASTSYGARTLTGALQPGETVVGDLQLEPMVRVASGRVLDSEGRPVAGASVRFGWPMLLRTGSNSSSRPYKPGTVTTGTNGDFAIHAPWGERNATLRLLASEGERFSKIAAVESGASDVQLTLSSAMGRIEGRLLLDPGVPADRLGVHPWSEDPLEAWQPFVRDDVLMTYEEEWTDTHTSSWSAIGEPPQPDGSFAFRALPGMYRLSVGLGSTEVFELPGVHVQAGTTTGDARLDPLDLRGKLHAFRLTLVPPEPSGVLRGTYLARWSNQDGAWESFEGSPLVLALHPVVDVELQVEGFRPVELHNVAADRTVTLEPGWPIRLVLADHVQVPKPPVSWSVVLRDENVHPLPRLTFAPGEREVRGVVTQPGELELEWIRAEPKGGDRLESAWGGDREGPAQTITVADQPGEQTFELGWVPAPR